MSSLSYVECYIFILFLCFNLFGYIIRDMGLFIMCGFFIWIDLDFIVLGFRFVLVLYIVL